MNFCNPKCKEDQGRKCHCSYLATRRVFWLDPAQEEPFDPALWVWGCIAVAFLAVVFWP